MTDKYILEGKIAKPVDLNTWARWYETADRHVAKSGSNEKGKVFISTVFLGLDHSFGHGKPLLFETMIFGGEHDQYQDRYSTWEEAVVGHGRACKMAGVEP
jgi:hypothetical protein